MIPTNAFIDDFSQALIATNGIFGSAADNLEFNLAINPFTPGPNLALGDLTAATFNGSATITAPFGPQILIRDGGLNQYGILIKEPAGGYKWVCTSAPTTPETVYGYYIVSAGALYFSALLPTPKVVSQPGDFIEISAVVGYLTPAPVGDNLVS